METKPLVTVLWPAMWARSNSIMPPKHREGWPAFSNPLCDLCWEVINEQPTFIEYIHHERKLKKNGLFD